MRLEEEAAFTKWYSPFREGAEKSDRTGGGPSRYGGALRAGPRPSSYGGALCTPSGVKQEDPLRR